ncbi:MAG: GTPase, partial [Gammaproteobacteria bacterium]
AEALDSAGGLNLAALYRDVLLKKPDPAALAARLRSPEARSLAYEMAVGVCDADGVQTPAEKAFLQELSSALGLAAPAAAAFSERAEALAASVDADAVAVTATASAATSAATSAPTLTRASDIPREQMDKMILDASIMNAALELLPESLSTLAIIPLQVRLVYRIGRSYGYPMDASQAKDFLATVGVGLGSQYLEQVGRKLLGGVLGSVLGGLGRSVGRQAASSGMSFASTWALGRVADRYYAGGREMNTAVLQASFRELLTEAKVLAPRYAGDIQRRAATIDTRELLSIARSPL